jgi:FixJ family two-component response regulator
MADDVGDEARLIAVADDDEAVLEAVSALLRSSGFEADTFSSERALLDSPRLARAASVIADVNMPGMSGLDLHRQLAAPGLRIPTILITAYPNARTRTDALPLCCTGR